MCLIKMQGADKVMLWDRIWGDRIIKPFFVDRNFHADKYFMLQKGIFPSLLYKSSNFPVYFQQDEAPFHFGIHVRRCVNARLAVFRWVN